MSVYSAWSKEPGDMRRSRLGPDPDTMRAWLAFLRIAVGALYLYAAISKITAGFLPPVLQHVTAFSLGAKLGLAQPILSFAMDHPRLFGWTMVAAELLAGALLFLGLGVRLVAGAALILQAVYLIVAFGSSTVVTLANCLFIAALLVIFGTDGGWRWSLDESIMNRR